jgi:hypothetical protein
MRSYPETRPVLSRLEGDILQVQNGRDRIRYGSGGEVVEHVKLDLSRLRRWGSLYIQSCPFDAYFLQDDIVVCHSPQPRSLPDAWSRYHTIMRTTWDLERLDTLGVFLDESFLREPTYDFVVRSPLAPRGIFRVGGGSVPRLLHARNDRYRIEVWDILTSRLAMVVERQVPGRERTDAEAEALVNTGDVGFYRSQVSFEVNPDDAHWAAIDSVSIAAALFLDELGYMWVRRGPSALDGEHARVREITGPDGMRWTVPAHSGL